MQFVRYFPFWSWTMTLQKYKIKRNRELMDLYLALFMVRPNDLNEKARGTEWERAKEERKKTRSNSFSERAHYCCANRINISVFLPNTHIHTRLFNSIVYKRVSFDLFDANDVCFIDLCVFFSSFLCSCIHSVYHLYGWLRQIYSCCFPPIERKWWCIWTISNWPVADYTFRYLYMVWWRQQQHQHQQRQW